MQESPISGNKLIANLKKLRETLRSRGVLLSFAFAFSIWLYITLQNTFSIYIDVPVVLKLSEEQTIESTIPKYLTVEVRGKGWDLFNLKYFGKSQKCFLNLTKYPNNLKSIDINYTKLVQSLIGFEQFEIKSITPESFSLVTSSISSEMKIVKSNIEIEPRDWFTLVGEIQIIPDSVETKGNKKVLDSIKNIFTENLKINDAYHDIAGTINLINELDPIIKINPKQVNYIAKIQQRCDFQINQVPIKIQGGVLPTNQIISPLFLTLYISGGIDEISSLNYDEIKATLTLDDIINDTTGILTPKIDLPPSIKVLKFDPPFVYHYTLKYGTLVQ
ncbi:MAG: hypothetical protein ACPL1A_05595 [Candidatus Kapaibacteriota bacterium]